MDNYFLIFIIALLVVSGAFASYTGINYLNSDIDSSDAAIPDDTTTADDVFSSAFAMNSEDPFIKYLVEFLIIVLVIIVFIIVYPFSS